jgi:hypothetical protein
LPRHELIVDVSFTYPPFNFRRRINVGLRMPGDPAGSAWNPANVLFFS